MEVFIDVKLDDTYQVGEMVSFDLTKSFVPNHWAGIIGSGFI